MKKSAAYKVPFTKFQAGFRHWKVVECDTTEQYELTCARLSGAAVERSPTEQGCTMVGALTIVLDREKHDTPEAYLHTFWHEMGHVLLYGLGLYKDVHHEAAEMYIDGFSGIFTHIMLTAK